MCGDSKDTVQEVLERIEDKFPNVMWGAQTKPSSWNPWSPKNNNVALFIEKNTLTYNSGSKEYVDTYVYNNYPKNDIVHFSDFLSEDDIQNEMSVSFLFN